MMRFFLFFLLGGFTCLLNAQRTERDEIETINGPLQIQPVFHGALVLTWNKKTIYVDPYGGAKAYESLGAPDLVLITDIHQDHLDLNTLQGIATDKATFLVPQAVADKLPGKFKNNMVVLNNGDSSIQHGISFTALPMYNLPEEPEARHTKGRGNGYVFSLGGKIIYISGDTEDIPEMRRLKDIDVAFVCMNLPYTMDIQQAASAVKAFKPAVVYPYHYRGQNGFSDVQEFKRLVNESNKGIDVRLKNWYPEY